MSTDHQIEQFRSMAKANPDDDLAHYALGQALVRAKRYSESVPVFRHVVRLNPQYTRAYLLLGEALIADEDEDGAIEAWQLGYHAAERKGELMVARELREHLETHNAPLSSDLTELLSADDDSESIPDREPEEGEVRCMRTGRVGKQMKFDPFGDQVGAYLMKHISQESWDAWIEMSIKVINELRLDLGDSNDQKTYDLHMRDFLNLPDSLFDE